MKSLKTVIHAHTNYSLDSNIAPAELVETARRGGIDCVAVADHNEIRGALEARQAAGTLRVIVGQEISTADGHLIGLFLEQVIPRGLSAEETIARIRAQGGLVLAPHPFATLCDNSLHDAVERLAPLLDAVEVFNAQNPFFWEDARAARFARRHGLTGYVGADAHVRGRPAPCYQAMPAFDGPQSFLRALRSAKLTARHFGPRYHAIMGLGHIWQVAFRRPLSGFGVNADVAERTCRRAVKA